MIRCNGCARRREALRRFFIPKSKKAPDMPKEPEPLKAQRTRSGDEWEVVNARNVVQSNGFDSEAEAESWIEERKKRKPK